ncbi:hypothetical protein K5X82_15180 [Halosquirtibacter xylanolyticus]|uniref:hypothetical protein n=1 Tax=Halosquirtibacter xylanolyticus TaxID=3374599 RepID=UPI00374783F3|nr:hypothetical protein K5X82_15180 [Prolixibacteraceae bacterium]
MKYLLIPIALIQFTYQHNALDALQLYLYLRNQRSVSFDTPTITTIATTFSCSIPTIKRRIQKLQRLRMIRLDRHRNHRTVSPSQLIKQHHLAPLGSLYWLNKYQMRHFKIIAIVTLLYYTAFRREMIQQKANHTAHYRKLLRKHSRYAPHLGMVLHTRQFTVPKNYLQKALRVSTSQFYRYRQQGQRLGLLVIQQNHQHLPLKPKEINGLRSHHKSLPYIIHRNGQCYLQKPSTITFKINIRL